MSMLLPLFAYGTLRDVEYQRELFDRTFPMEPAIADNFIVVSGGGGYLAAIPQSGGSVSGMIVALDAAAYAVADAWEDLTVYRKISVDVRTNDGRICTCSMYIRPDVRGMPIMDERTAELARADVIADIRRFRALR